MVVTDGAGVRDALIRQWSAIAQALPGLDLHAPSRVLGWRNREVVAHLALQPVLLVRFIGTASYASPEVSLAANLAGTARLAETIDVAARGATDAHLDFEEKVKRALPAVVEADLTATVSTIQGPINLADYLRTRCVEAVVHGCDLQPPVNPDSGALEIAAAALLKVLRTRRPDLVAVASALPPLEWVDQATGRTASSGPLLGVLPVMT